MGPKTSGSWFVMKVRGNKRFLGKRDVIWAQEKTFCRFLSSNSHIKWKFLAACNSKVMNIMGLKLSRT